MSAAAQGILTGAFWKASLAASTFFLIGGFFGFTVSAIVITVQTGSFSPLFAGSFVCMGLSAVTGICYGCLSGRD